VVFFDEDLLALEKQARLDLSTSLRFAGREKESGELIPANLLACHPPPRDFPRVVSNSRNGRDTIADAISFRGIKKFGNPRTT